MVAEECSLCAWAGTRYIFTGKLFERRPSYHLLGALLFLQLGIAAAGWGLARLQASVAGGAPPGAGAAAGASEAGERERKGGPAVLLQVRGCHSAEGRGCSVWCHWTLGVGADKRHGIGCARLCVTAEQYRMP